VQLAWRTLSEINNLGFEVHRSPVAPTNWSLLPNSFRPGFGTTNIPHDYAFTDSSVTPGVWYYRLRQISQDSTSNILSPISINVLTKVSEENLPAEYVVSQNYPNPFNPRTTISFGLPARTHVRLELFNMLGQSVGVIVDSDIQAGYHSVSIDASQLASGIYLYRLNAGEFSQTRKLILTK
jgi:hypothetical protein